MLQQAAQTKRPLYLEDQVLICLTPYIMRCIDAIANVLVTKQCQACGTQTNVRLFYIQLLHNPFLVVVEWLACFNDPESYASGRLLSW